MGLYFTQDKDTYPMLHTTVYEYCKTIIRINKLIIESQLSCTKAVFRY